MNKRTYSLLLSIGIIGLLGIVINYHNANGFTSLDKFLEKTDSLMYGGTHWYSITFVVYCFINVKNRKTGYKHDKGYSSKYTFVYIIVLSIAEFFFMGTFYTGLFIYNGTPLIDFNTPFIDRIPGNIIHIYVPVLFFILFRLEKVSIIDHKEFNKKAFYLCLIEPATGVLGTTLRGFYVYSNGNYETSSDIMPYAPYLDLFGVGDIEGYITPPLIFRVIGYVWCLVFMYGAGFGAFHGIIEANNRGYKKKTNKKNSK